MTNKTKKISITALEKCVLGYSDGATVTKDWRGISVVIKPRLSLVGMMTFVDGVVKSCFTNDGATYSPEVRDFAIRCSVLEMYANFTLPANIEKRYELAYGCDAYGVIMDTIDRGQFDAMMRAIDEKIEHIAELNIGAVNKQVSELYTALSKVGEQLSSMFDGVDGDVVAKLAGALSDGGIDETKLMHAYFNEKLASEQNGMPVGE